MDAGLQGETKPTMFRLFIALAVPEKVKDEIRSARDQLRGSLPKRCARWTQPEQWHLTLKFLGNVDAKRVDSLKDAVRVTCAGFAPLGLRAEQIGFFPDMRFPRVVWVGVCDAENHLVGLAKAIEDATGAFSSEPRKQNFAGHITLARIKNLKGSEADILARISKGMLGRVFGEWTADAIELMRSELATDGAKHSCLARLLLQGAMGKPAS